MVYFMGFSIDFPFGWSIIINHPAFLGYPDDFQETGGWTLSCFRFCSLGQAQENQGGDGGGGSKWHRFTPSVVKKLGICWRFFGVVNGKSTTWGIYRGNLSLGWFLWFLDQIQVIWHYRWATRKASEFRPHKSHLEDRLSGGWTSWKEEDWILPTRWCSSTYVSLAILCQRKWVFIACRVAFNQKSGRYQKLETFMPVHGCLFLSCPPKRETRLVDGRQPLPQILPTWHGAYMFMHMYMYRIYIYIYSHTYAYIYI